MVIWQRVGCLLAHIRRIELGQMACLGVTNDDRHIRDAPACQIKVVKFVTRGNFLVFLPFPANNALMNV